MIHCRTLLYMYSLYVRTTKTKQNKINFVDKLNISAVGVPEHPLINIHSIASSLFRRTGAVSTIIDLALNTFMYLS